MTMRPCDTSQHVRVTLPWGIAVTANKAIRERLLLAAGQAKATSDRRVRNGKRGWVPKRVDSYVCRKIRGAAAWSRHAFAAALDWFDRSFPQPVDVWGPANAPPAWFANVFKRWGFTLGRDWSSRKDYPHIEWRTNTVPPVRVIKRFRIQKPNGKWTKLLTRPQARKRVNRRMGRQKAGAIRVRVVTRRLP